MTIPNTVKEFMDSSDIPYTIIDHDHTATSLQSARTAHIPATQLAKAVLLEDNDGQVLAVLPADRELEPKFLEREFGRHLELTQEAHLSDTFTDCASGAVPALGPAYGVTTVVDRALLVQDDVYFEAGSHEQLIHLSGKDLRRLLPNSRFASIGSRTTAAERA